jgi:hypothetical protein
MMCLALTVYHEAQNQSLDGQIVVAKVVIERQAKIGQNACDVAFAYEQFSWANGHVHITGAEKYYYVDKRVITRLNSKSVKIVDDKFYVKGKYVPSKKMMLVGGKYHLDPKYIPTEVLKQARLEKRNLLHAGFKKEARSIRTIDPAWDRAMLIARIADKMSVRQCEGATNYHTTAVNPRWNNVVQLCVIDDHIFYKEIPAMSNKANVVSATKTTITLPDYSGSVFASLVVARSVNNNNRNSLPVILSQYSTKARRFASEISLLVNKPEKEEEVEHVGFELIYV